MKKFPILFFLIITLNACGQPPNKKSLTENVDWRKHPVEYAEQKIPLKEEIVFDSVAVSLRDAHVAKWDEDSVVIAFCDLVPAEKGYCSMIIYILFPNEKDKYYRTGSVKVKGCNMTMPAYTFADIDNDGKIEFIYLCSFDLNCKGYLITNCDVFSKNERRNTPSYLALNSNGKINSLNGSVDGKARVISREEMQKALDEGVAEIINEKQ